MGGKRAYKESPGKARYPPKTRIHLSPSRSSRRAESGPFSASFPVNKIEFIKGTLFPNNYSCLTSSIP